MDVQSTLASFNSFPPVALRATRTAAAAAEAPIFEVSRRVTKARGSAPKLATFVEELPKLIDNLLGDKTERKKVTESALAHWSGDQGKGDLLQCLLDYYQAVFKSSQEAARESGKATDTVNVKICN